MAKKEAWDVIDYDAGKVRVLLEKCSTCIFNPGNPMFLGPGRLKEVVNGNLESGCLLTCHKTLPYSEGNNDPAVCRGFWDSYGMQTTAGRYAQLVIGIMFVNLEEQGERIPPEDTADPRHKPEEAQAGEEGD